MAEVEVTAEDTSPGFLSRLCCLCGLCRLGEKVKKAQGKIDKYGDKEIVIDHQYTPNRWPTDIICIYLFAAVWIGMIIIAVFAVERGDPRTLVYPSDKENNICGESNTNSPPRDLTGKDYLWYPFSVDVQNPEQSRLMDALDMGICVTNCPNRSMIDLIDLNIDMLTDGTLGAIGRDTVICEYEYQELSVLEQAKQAQNGTGCYFNWLPTTVMNRRCIPDFTKANTSTISTQFLQVGLYGWNAVKAGFYELQASWVVLVFVILLMIIICFVFLCLVQTLVKVLVYMSLFILFFVIGCVAAYAGWVGYRKYDEASETGDSEQLRWSYLWMVIGGVAAAAELVYLCLMIFLMNRIGIAIEIITIAARPIQKVPWMLAVPPLTFAVAIGVGVYWAIIASYIASSKVEIEVSGAEFSDLMDYVDIDLNTTTNSTTVVSSDNVIQALQFYHLFGFFWTNAFIMAFGYCIVAGVVAKWYFSSHVEGGKKAGLFPVIRSAGRVLIFHSGSVLFGSLLVAIIQMIRVIVHMIEKQVKRAKGKNKITTAIFKIIKVILYICEKLIKFINKNAYIMMMIHGSSFVCSSVRAMTLIIFNIVQIGVVNFIGDFMLFLGQIALTVGGTLITYFLIDLANGVTWLNWMIYLAPKELSVEEGVELFHISYSIIPTFAGFVISFVVSGLFINLYSTSIDTILLCFCEDRKVNDGSEDRPYFMPKELETKLGCRSRVSMHQPKESKIGVQKKKKKRGKKT